MRVGSFVKPGWSTASQPETHVQHVDAYTERFGA